MTCCDLRNLLFDNDKKEQPAGAGTNPVEPEDGTAKVGEEQTGEEEYLGRSRRLKASHLSPATESRQLKPSNKRHRRRDGELRQVEAECVKDPLNISDIPLSK